MSPDADLIGSIYEASSITERWPRVLERLSDVAGCFGATLVTVDPVQNVRFVATESLQSFMDVFVRDGWMPRNSRAGRLAPKRYHGFVTDLDLFTEDEMRTDPFYAEFLRPNGGGWGSGTVINVPSGDTVIFNLERANRDGPVAAESVKRLDALRPHLARAALLSTRLGLERARQMTNVLASVGLAAAVLGRKGTLLAANDLFQVFIPSVARDSRTRVSLADAQADVLLARALQRLESPASVRNSVLSIPLKAALGHPPMIFHLLPIVGDSRDIFSHAVSILLVTAVERRAIAKVDLLGGLFDLTPAEATVAANIAGGWTVEEIAEQVGRSRETIRTQLKAIFAKTGVARQTELALLLSASAFWPEYSDRDP